MTLIFLFSNTLILKVNIFRQVGLGLDGRLRNPEEKKKAPVCNIPQVNRFTGSRWMSDSLRSTRPFGSRSDGVRFALLWNRLSHRSETVRKTLSDIILVFPLCRSVTCLSDKLRWLPEIPSDLFKQGAVATPGAGDTLLIWGKKTLSALSGRLSLRLLTLCRLDSESLSLTLKKGFSCEDVATSQVWLPVFAQLISFQWHRLCRCSI